MWGGTRCKVNSPLCDSLTTNHKKVGGVALSDDRGRKLAKDLRRLTKNCGRYELNMDTNKQSYKVRSNKKRRNKREHESEPEPAQNRTCSEKTGNHCTREKMRSWKKNSIKGGSTFALNSGKVPFKIKRR